ncbi:unnamed protein product [Rhodiola kirilowii]
MDTQFHSLPPLKRLSLRQNPDHPLTNKTYSCDGDFTLPTKKRTQSRHVPSTFLLPTKKRKRVWASQPDYCDFVSTISYEDTTAAAANSIHPVLPDQHRGCMNSSILEDDCHFSLPAKKRRESRDHVYAANATISLLNKKRVCAFNPDIFDLNVEYKPSALYEDCQLGKNDGLDFEENPIEVKISEVVEEPGNDDEFDFDLNQAVNICQVKEDSVDLGSVNDGVDGYGHDLENVSGFESATDGNGECGVFDINLVSSDWDNNPSIVTDFHSSVDGESEHLTKVSSADGGFEGDCESEDGVVCEICQSTDGDPSDPIVFCDGCDLMVHASCYGNPLIKGIPEGDWFCDKCTFKAENPSKAITCCLCPSARGGLKSTNDGRWAHIVCAVFVPEAFFVDPQGREGIDVSRISAKRWKRICYMCKKRKGCVVDCSEAKCCLSFHVTCGLNEDLCIEYRDGNMKKGGIVAGFCKDHTELWKKQQQTGKFKIVAREER